MPPYTYGLVPRDVQAPPEHFRFDEELTTVLVLPLPGGMNSGRGVGLPAA